MKSIEKLRLIAILCIAVMLMTVLAGCVTKRALVGQYEGTSGSFLKLNGDGTCLYSEYLIGAESGTWYIEDGMIYINANNLDFTLFGDVSDADEGILLQSESTRWSNEYFRRVK